MWEGGKGCLKGETGDEGNRKEGEVALSLEDVLRARIEGKG